MLRTSRGITDMKGEPLNTQTRHTAKGEWTKRKQTQDKLNFKGDCRGGEWGGGGGLVDSIWDLCEAGLGSIS